jgi:selenide,water dikinase
LLAGAQALMERGFASGGAKRTRAHLGARLAVGDGVSETLLQLAADSETSGGLLIAVAPERAAALEAELRARAVPVHAIGRVEAAAGPPRMRLER